MTITYAQTDVVPLVDLRRDRIPDDVLGAFRRGEFVGGWYVSAFEKEWALRTHASACVGVNSGTDALTLLLRAHARKKPLRTRAVIPATSFVATLEAVVNAGLHPILCDVGPDGLISRTALRHLLNARVDPSDVLAIVPVHLYGRVAEVDDVAEEFRVPYVIEDACQAHGARYRDGTPVGSRNPAAWSFMPAKILGAAGDAGAMTLPSRRKGDGRPRPPAGDLRALANHGRSAHSVHGLPGFNSRLDNVQAAVLYGRYLETDRMTDLLAGRARAAAYYYSRLHTTGVFIDHGVRAQSDEAGRVWSYYTLRVDPDDRDPLRAHLDGRGVSTGCHYPYTLADAFRGRGFGVISSQFPMARDLASRTLTLPLWPDMPTSVQDRVVDAVLSYYEEGP